MIKERLKNTSKANLDSNTGFDFALYQIQLSDVSAYDPDGSEVLHDLENLQFRDAPTCVSSLLDVAHQQKSQTKEILAYHVQGFYYLYKKKFNDALQSFEKAMTVARKAGNEIALAIIGFDYIKVCNIKQRWDLAYQTLIDIEKIYHEMDLVDEKIHAMIHLSDFHRKFGKIDKALKLLNLANNLHTNFAEFSHYQNQESHAIFLKLSLAWIEKKNGHYKTAIELINSLITRFEDHTPPKLENHNRLHSIATLYLVLAECYLETSQREKSVANLTHLKKFIEKHPDSVLEAKYQIIKKAHELFFEKKNTKADVWVEAFEEPWSLGDTEFCLDFLIRILNKYNRDGVIDQYMLLVEFYQHCLDAICKRLPKSFLNEFIEYYHFEQALMVKASTDQQLKSIIDFSRTLVCEHRLDELSGKSLDLIADFTKMDRGFLLLFDSTNPRVVATFNMNKKHIETQTGLNYNCLNLARNVLKNRHPFIKIKHHTQDLFQIEENEANLIKAIQKTEYMIFPLVVGENGIGVIYLDSDNQCQIEDNTDIENLENMISLIAFAINNAYHIKAKEVDIKSVKKLLDKHQNELEIQKHSYENFIGISDKKTELFQTLQKTLDNNATITLIGESGVGKEMIAKMIHYNGMRKQERFVALNCAAIPENLMESELFGYLKGSFTGADEDKEGLFVAAHNGTLFLDEIGEMPLSLQVKLIRVLQEREVTPIGGSEPKKIDVRIVCATNRDLEEMVSEGSFREDLYYRINVIKIDIPSLRERKEDIPFIAEHALRMYAIENNVPQKTLSSQALKFVTVYPWPGNVRELINVMYNLSIFVEKPQIDLKDLEERHELFRSPIDMNATQTSENYDLNELSDAIDEHDITLSEAKQEFEKLQIERALKLYNNQITSASYHLQMPRPQVSRLVKKYGLKEIKT